jgi:hypothetical protein
MSRAAGTRRVHLAGIKLNSEPAVVPIVPEASRGKTGAPSQVIIAEARRRISAAGGIKASHPPGAVEAVAAVAEAVAMVVVAAAGVAAADAAGADAAGNRLEQSTQPLYKRRNLQWCDLLIERKELLG